MNRNLGERQKEILKFLWKDYERHISTWKSEYILMEEVRYVEAEKVIEHFFPNNPTEIQKQCVYNSLNRLCKRNLLKKLNYGLYSKYMYKMRPKGEMGEIYYPDEIRWIDIEWLISR
jgi:hypothetical protein